MTQNSNNNPLLQRLIDEAMTRSQLNKADFYVFDIDSTLLDVSPRIQNILNDFLKSPELAKNHPEILAQIKHISVKPTDWGIRHAFERLNIPNLPESIKEKAKNYWREHFFANTHLPLDRPYEGATEFVQTIHNLGHHIFYLTGRDVHRMGEGTVSSLKQHGFPIETAKAQLILKPDKNMVDTHYKKDWFEQIIKVNPDTQFLFFENEPLNIEAVRHLHPVVKVIFFDSTHSGKLDSPTDLPKIQNFKV